MKIMLQKYDKSSKLQSDLSLRPQLHCQIQDTLYQAMVDIRTTLFYVILPLEY